MRRFLSLSLGALLLASIAVRQLVRMGRHLLPASCLIALLVLAAAGSAAPTRVQWANGGPEGGSILSLVSSPAAPNTVYAGTYDGVYKSTSFGASWHRLSNELPTGAGQILAVDPRTPERVYAWAHGGIWRSLDGGRHWSSRGVAPEKMWGVLRMAVAPSAPRTLYALTGGWALPALWRSTNAGRSWRRFALPARPILDLAVDPLSARRVYLGALSTIVDGRWVSGGVLVSTNAGRTWWSRVAEDTHSLAVDPVSRIVYAGGGSGKIYRSDDLGEHWRTVARLAAKDRVVALAVDPGDPEVIYALTMWGVHRSVDRGLSWRLVGKRSFGLTHSWPWVSHFATVAVHPARSDQILVSPGAGVWRSANRAATWTVANNGLVATSVTALAVHPSNPLVAYAVADAQLWVTGDGGHRWRSVSALEAVALALDPRHPMILYATGMGVRRSADGGRTWKMLRRGPAYDIVVDPTQPSTLYVSTGQRVVKSTDGGSTWSAASSGLPALRASDYRGTLLAVDPVQTSTLYFVVTAEAQRGGSTVIESHAFKTTDGGATWQPLEGVPDIWVDSIAVDPRRSDTVYLGDVQGIYRSDDGGLTWMRTSYPSGACRLTLAVDPLRSGVVYAGAADGCPRYPGAVLVTKDRGETWRAVNGVRANVQELAVGARGSRLYAATGGSGVFASRLPLAAP